MSNRTCNVADQYQDFDALKKAEIEGTDFRIRSHDRNSKAVVIAPHGGGIEPGTSELAEAIAGASLSFYAFEGMKQAGNSRLHITSTRFDEPICSRVLSHAERVIAVHGGDGEDAVVYLGGLYTDGIERLQKALNERDFNVTTDGPMHLQGTSPANVCNKGTSRAGIQLELSNGLRRTFFKDLKTRTGREIVSPRFDEFVEGVREVVLAEFVRGQQ